MIRVFLADDHSIVRQGIKRLIAETGRMSVIGEASSTTELKSSEKLRESDVLVLDLSMPEGHGLDALKDLRGELPSLPVIILSVYPEDQYALRSIRAGASGYLCKECAPDQLVSAIDTVVKGSRYISPKIAKLLSEGNGTKRDSAEPHQELSDREFMVFRMIAEGIPLTHIANKLSVSVKTVSTYRSRILRKMAFKANADIVRYAIKHNLIQAEM